MNLEKDEEPDYLSDYTPLSDVFDKILSKSPEEILRDIDDEEDEDDGDYFERKPKTDVLLSDISRKLDTIINLLRKR